MFFLRLFQVVESNESGASNNHAVEQMRKDMEQQIIELTGRLKLKDEVNFYFFPKAVSLDNLRIALLFKCSHSLRKKVSRLNSAEQLVLHHPCAFFN